MDRENRARGQLIHDVYHVFTPNSPARLTFVDRELLTERVVDALLTPGKQLIVYGHSGSGKTTLLKNKLEQLYERHITTRCVPNLNYDQILKAAFDELEAFYIKERSAERIRKGKFSLGQEYLSLKAEFQAELRRGETIARVVSPQLNAQNLAAFFGDIEACWVLEDFHKVSEEAKVKLGGAMKVFSDMSSDDRYTKIVAIGAVNSPREIVSVEESMNSRVAEIEVPLMADGELNSILVKGQQLLNIEFRKPIRTETVRFSNGLAAVCHQLALNMCTGSRILNTRVQKQALGKGAFDSAIRRYIEDQSDTIKAALDKALVQRRKRKYDNCRIILTAIAKLDATWCSRSDIVSTIAEESEGYPQGNLTTYLKELQREERGHALVFDAHAQKYAFSTPFLKVFARMVLVYGKKKSDEETLRRAIDALSFEDITKAILKSLESTGKFK